MSIGDTVRIKATGELMTVADICKSDGLIWFGLVPAGERLTYLGQTITYYRSFEMEKQ